MAKKEVVPKAWRIIQILIFILTFLAGGIAFIPLSFVRYNFGVCVLYGEIYYTVTYNITANSSLESTILYVKYPDTIWAYSQTCEYSIYANVASTIFAFIMIWFFVVCKATTDGSGIPKPWRIVVPTVIICSIMALLEAIASYLLMNGFKVLCKNIEKGPIKSCWDAQKVVWSGIPLANGFYDQLFISLIGSWSTTSLWLLAVAVLGSRCVLKIDFQNYKAVKTREPQSEVNPTFCDTQI